MKVISQKPDKSAVKRKVCPHCAATLEYVANDVLEYNGRDYSGGSDGRKWIVCANCNKDITLESW
jgi:hypothetical protein